MKDTKTFVMAAGLDRSDASAQELKFDGDYACVSALVMNNFYNDKRFDFTSGDLDYKGVHITHKVATTDTGWIVWKYTWSAGNLARIEGPLTGSWDGRADLAWA